MSKTKESEMLQKFGESISELAPVEFVEAYNIAFGADLIIGDIKWDGGTLEYESAS